MSALESGRSLSYFVLILIATCLCTFPIVNNLISIGQIETEIHVYFDSHALSNGCLCRIFGNICRSYQHVRGYVKFTGISPVKCEQEASFYTQYKCQTNISTLYLYPRSNSCFNESCINEIDDFPAILINNITIDGRVSLLYPLEVVNITMHDIEASVVYEDILLTREVSLSVLLEKIPPPPLEESYPKIGLVDIKNARLSALFQPHNEIGLAVGESNENESYHIKKLASLPIADDLLDSIRQTTLDAGHVGTFQRDIPLLIKRLIENAFIGVLGEKRISEFNKFLRDVDDVLKQITSRWSDTYKDIEASSKHILHDAEKWKEIAFYDLDKSISRLSFEVENLKERWETVFHELIQNPSVIFVGESVKNTRKVLEEKLKDAEQWRDDTAAILLPIVTKLKTDFTTRWDAISMQWNKHLLFACKHIDSKGCLLINQRLRSI